MGSHKKDFEGTEDLIRVALKREALRKVPPGKPDDKTLKKILDKAKKGK